MRRHQRLRQGNDEANERQQIEGGPEKGHRKKNGRGRAALTKSNWGRSTFRASWKLWASATLVSVAFFDHAAETLTQYTSNAAQAKDALASPFCKGLSSGTAARKASRRSTEMRGLTTVTTALGGAGAGAFGWNREKTRWAHDCSRGASSVSSTPSNLSKAAEAAKMPTPAILPSAARPHPNMAMAPSSP